MRLQRVTSRTAGRRRYQKYLVTLPEELIRTLGWRPGGELTTSIMGKQVVLSYMAPKKSTVSHSGAETSGYVDFRDRIRAELKAHPEGRTWTQIKTALRLPQKVPNNGWVRLMERDIGLLRLKSSRGTVWVLK